MHESPPTAASPARCRFAVAYGDAAARCRPPPMGRMAASPGRPGGSEGPPRAGQARGSEAGLGAQAAPRAGGRGAGGPGAPPPPPPAESQRGLCPVALPPRPVSPPSAPPSPPGSPTRGQQTGPPQGLAAPRRGSPTTAELPVAELTPRLPPPPPAPAASSSRHHGGREEPDGDAAGGAASGEWKAVAAAYPSDTSDRRPAAHHVSFQLQRSSSGIVAADAPSLSHRGSASSGVLRTQKVVSSFRLSSPEILRACHAGGPLRCCGRIFFPEASEGSNVRILEKEVHVVHSERAEPEDFSTSFRADLIQDFWSHSWHARPRAKILTLLFIYNGHAAVMFGSCMASIGFALSAGGVLPPMVYTSSESGFLHGNVEYGFAAWSQVFGLLTFIATLLFWYSKRLVFLDKACIHQTDERLKTQGVESIGAFLKHSENMIVLWDQTYVKRLWCIFEMAAFVRTHRTRLQRHLRIRPIELGPVLLSFFFVTWSTTVMAILTTNGPLQWVAYGLWAFGWLHPAYKMHVYRQNLQVLWQDFDNFAFSGAKCHCCTINHVTEEGKPIPCDRKLVHLCIEKWFKDVDVFEEFVKKDVKQYFQQQLGPRGLPYRWTVLAMTPVMWWQMEYFAAHAREHDVRPLLVASLLLSSLMAWLCGGPMALAIITELVDRLAVCRRCPWLSALISAFAGAAGGASAVALMVFASLEAYKHSRLAFGLLLLGEVLATGALYMPRDAGPCVWSCWCLRPRCRGCCPCRRCRR